MIYSYQIREPSATFPPLTQSQDPEPRSLGRLCSFNECPKGKADCLVPGCGAIAFNKVVADFAARADLLATARQSMLYERDTGLCMSALDLPGPQENMTAGVPALTATSNLLAIELREAPTMESQHTGPIPAVNLSPKPSLNSIDIVLVLFLYSFMQVPFQFAQAADLRSIRDRPAVHFGKIRVEERPDPVSQFVGSILGSRTHNEISWNAFVRLIMHFRNWNAIADAPEADIEGFIWDVAYPEKKAPDLKRALRIIRACSGEINLDFLVDLEVEQALHWLERIHGVGRKTAAAMLNFSSLRGRAFVVDTHVLRVLRRFGFVGENALPEHVYDSVMAAEDDFDVDDLFELHWYLKRIGRKTCLHARALCVSCPLSDICLQRVEERVHDVMRSAVSAA